MVTTIQIDEKLKSKLDKLKVHHRETYNDLIGRIINVPKNREVDTESLIETIEVLGDPEAMRDIAESLEEINKGNYGTSLDEVEKELGL